MTPIRTERLILRNWRESDRPVFHRINSDPVVMEFFPFRRNRAESDALMDRLSNAIARDGYGFAAVELAGTGDCIGFSGLNIDKDIPFAPAIEIGWRLVPEYWGMGYATESALVWLDFGFSSLKADRICSFAVSGNFRSTAVMERIGMRRAPALDFDHPRIPDDRPDLSRHVVYDMTRDDWLARA